MKGMYIYKWKQIYLSISKKITHTIKIILQRDKETWVNQETERITYQFSYLEHSNYVLFHLWKCCVLYI